MAVANLRQATSFRSAPSHVDEIVSKFLPGANDSDPGISKDIERLCASAAREAREASGVHALGVSTGYSGGTITAKYVEDVFHILTVVPNATDLMRQRALIGYQWD